jgi:hypothetical protein
MLDNTENPRLHDLLGEIAPLLSSLTDDFAGVAACPSFSEDKVRRVLDRVYNRIADEAAEPASPRLRRLIAEIAALTAATGGVVTPCPSQRILNLVQARQAAEQAASQAEAAKTSGQKSATRASLRSVAAAFFMPRRLAFGADSMLPDDPGDR